MQTSKDAADRGGYPKDDLFHTYSVHTDKMYCDRSHSLARSERSSKRQRYHIYRYGLRSIRRTTQLLKEADRRRKPYLKTPRGDP